MSHQSQPELDAALTAPDQANNGNVRREALRGTPFPSISCAAQHGMLIPTGDR